VTPAPAGPARTGAADPNLDLDALGAGFAAKVPGAGDRVHATLIHGGRSNLTYVVTDGAHEWIVRRPPPGDVLATAHDMAREYRVMSSLRHTAVPVPRTFALCTDRRVLGVDFYVMERCHGTPYRRAAELARLGPERTRTISERLVDTLAVLDWELATLGDPLTDLALLLVHNRLAAIVGDVSDAVSDVSTAPGFLDERGVIERYSGGAHRDLSDLGFHLGLATFKLAAILEGVHHRHLRGQTVGVGFDRIGEAVPPLLRAGLDTWEESS